MTSPTQKPFSLGARPANALAALLASSLLFGACVAPGNQPAVENTTISVSGAFALFPLMTIWADEYSKLNPAVTFDVQAGGAGKGMTDVLAGAVDVAMRPEGSDHAVPLHEEVAGHAGASDQEAPKVAGLADVAHDSPCVISLRSGPPAIW